MIFKQITSKMDKNITVDQSYWKSLMTDSDSEIFQIYFLEKINQSQEAC